MMWAGIVTGRNRRKLQPFQQLSWDRLRTLITRRSQVRILPPLLTVSFADR